MFCVIGVYVVIHRDLIYFTEILLSENPKLVEMKKKVSFFRVHFTI